MKPAALKGIQRLEDQAQQAALEHELAALPPSARGAFFLQATPDGEVRLRAAARLSKGWSVASLAEKRPGQRIEGSIMVTGYW